MSDPSLHMVFKGTKLGLHLGWAAISVLFPNAAEAVPHFGGRQLFSGWWDHLRTLILQGPQGLLSPKLHNDFHSDNFLVWIKTYRKYCSVVILLEKERKKKKEKNPKHLEL